MGALKQHTQRVHVQARVWGQARVAHQKFINHYRTDSLKMTTEFWKYILQMSCQPQQLSMMVCHCKRKCSTQKCGCKSDNLACIVFWTMRAKMVTMFTLMMI